MTSLPIRRCPGGRLTHDPRRVITTPFIPGDVPLSDGRTRTAVAVTRILAMPEIDVAATLAATRELFGDRHRELDATLEAHARIVAERATIPADISQDRLRLIGAYFTREYAIEAAALGNPSIVVAPDQHGVAPGSVRFVMSLRAIGEGHISCIEFRTGTVDADLQVTMDDPGPYAQSGRRSDAEHDREFFATKLAELGALDDVTTALLDRLGEVFTSADLERAIASLGSHGIHPAAWTEAVHVLHWLAASNYQTSFPADIGLGERVIFPAGPAESNGMEDVRLVRFTHDDGTVDYFGTYTAFDGHQVLPQLLRTRDFVTFRISTLSGSCAHNKGIALFPRKVGGEFMALGRHDNVNNFLMTSTDIHVWRETERIQEPKQPWELLQLGNCGSPLETDAGWLVITHGVGPMRQYQLGALLLDRDDPARVIGHLVDPLMTGTPAEREGYVPNVLYSCGSLLHGEHLVLPYGFADMGAAVATVAMDDLLERLVT